MTKTTVFNPADYIKTPEALSAYVLEFVREEREQCAKIAENFSTKEFDTAWVIARAIRR